MLVILALALILPGLTQDAGPATSVHQLPGLEIGGGVLGVVTNDDPIIRTELLASYYRSPSGSIVGKSFRVQVEESGPHHISLRSIFFDSYLVLRDESGEVLAEDDDGLGGEHSRVVFELVAGEIYRVDACALYGRRGSFEIGLRAGLPSDDPAPDRASAGRLDQRPLPPVSDLPALEPGVRLSADITNGDPIVVTDVLLRERWSTGRIVGKSFGVQVEESGPYLIELHSYFLDTYLVLRDESGAVLAEDDDGLVNTHSQVAFELVAGEIYRVDAAALHRKRGLIELELRPGRAARSPEERDAAAREDRQRWAEVLAGLPQDRAVMTSRHRLGDVLRGLREFEAASEQYEITLEWIYAHEPGNENAILIARKALASTLKGMGQLEPARELQESILAARERTLPEHDSRVLWARSALALTLVELGELEAACELQRSCVTIRERFLSADDPDLLISRMNLGGILEDLEDFDAARAMRESVLAICERTFPPDHATLLKARLHLSGSLAALGDLDASRMLKESVLSVYERTLAADDPRLIAIRQNLGVVLQAQGDYEGARMLFETVLADAVRAYPKGDRMRLTVRENLSNSLFRFGEFEAARQQQESVLATRQGILPADHPATLRSRMNLARTLQAMGEADAARTLIESVVVAHERMLSASHSMSLASHTLLARILALQGDLEAARALLPGLISASRGCLEGLVATSPREARAIARDEASVRLEIIFFLSEGGAPDESLRAEVFDLVETVRHVSQATPTANLGAMDAEVEALRSEAARLRRKLNDLVSGDRPKSIADEVIEVSRRRDRVERTIRARLAEQGHFTRSIRAQDVALGLGPDAAAVGFLRYARMSRDPETASLPSTPSLLAHVVLPDQRAMRVELGPIAELEGLAHAWRTALGKSVGPEGRGVAVEESGADATEDEVAAGEALRRRILDPVLAVIGDADSLHVCLDDLLCLIPLDALPMAGGRVGDRYQIVGEVSFARLIAAPRAPGPEGGLLALGGASFDNEPGDPAVASVDLGSSPLASVTRSLSGAGFTALPHTRLEVEAVGELFDTTFDRQAAFLLGEGASKSALHARAPGARFLHIATHGWFVPDNVRSQKDDPSSRSLRPMAGTGEIVRGLAPMTLCGLALAGANLGRDSDGHVPGILTAEELASIDLSECELAVLSACETNVGLRRAGQGIQSLQSALYAAGARTSVTSLWRVDDALTHQLMEQFYSNLWIDEMGKAEALWQAKRALREEGHPVRDWAGWTLTGDPN